MFIRIDLYFTSGEYIFPSALAEKNTENDLDAVKMLHNHILNDSIILQALSLVSS